nr:hypothetical protein [uncultured Pseudodesulfovibrio sp.]
MQLALESQDVPYHLKFEVAETSELRRREIAGTSSKNYVIALGNRADHEHLLQPVCVPIQLGLGLGYRIMLTRTGMEDRLGKVQTLEDLSDFVLGQGLGWADVEILRAAGLRVVTPTKATSIPRMMMEGRIDLYPRGLFEIDAEYARYKTDYPSLIIDENLVLHYPLVSFFFTRKGNDKLFNVIKNGMENAYQTGKLQDLIMSDPVFREAIRHIQLNKRVTIEIPVQDINQNTRTALERFPFVPGKPLGQPVQ